MTDKKLLFLVISGALVTLCLVVGYIHIMVRLYNDLGGGILAMLVVAAMSASVAYVIKEEK